MLYRKACMIVLSNLQNHKHENYEILTVFHWPFRFDFSMVSLYVPDFGYFKLISAGKYLIKISVS